MEHHAAAAWIRGGVIAEVKVSSTTPSLHTSLTGSIPGQVGLRRKKPQIAFCGSFTTAWRTGNRGRDYLLRDMQLTYFLLNKTFRALLYSAAAGVATMITTTITTRNVQRSVLHYCLAIIWTRTIETTCNGLFYG